MGYEVSDINSEGWIFIYHEDSIDETDSFERLIKSIQQEIGGKIIRIQEDDDLFKLENDKMGMVFQWDSCFGNVVRVEDMRYGDKILQLLKKHCKKLNLLEENEH